MRLFRQILHLLPGAMLLPAQDLREFQKSVTEFTLPNGLHFILVERHDVPVIAFHTYVKVGSVNDPPGKTGMAHILEHMAFKGTESIGSKNWQEEKKAIDATEEAYDRWDAERSKTPKANQSRVDMLRIQWDLAAGRAELYVQPNEFTRILEENGARDVAVAAGPNSTETSYSLASNRMELWFLMESQRLLRPVFRQFYKERESLLAEYQQADSNPEGKLRQSLLAAAFAAHPYKNPSTGWPSDIPTLRLADARAFFDKYYVPANMVMTMVGDINVAEGRRAAERYFGPLRTKPVPSPPHIQEPPQSAPKTSVLEPQAQPMAAFAFKRPDQYDKDDPVFDVLQAIFSNARSGLLHKQLVEEKRLAVTAEAVATLPDGRYPNLFAFLLVPALDHTAAELDQALADLLAGLKLGPVDPEALQGAKNRVRASLLHSIANSNGLAKMLSVYYAEFGDWRKMWAFLEAVNKVTAEDVQRVAQQYFQPSQRIMVSIPSLREPAGVRP